MEGVRDESRDPDGAALSLVLTPATVSFPIALAEFIVLVGGLATMLALDLALLRRVFGPLRRLTAMMRGVDPLRPGVGRRCPGRRSMTCSIRE